MNKYIRNYIKKEETTKPKLSLSELVELYENNEIGLKTIKENLDENMKRKISKNKNMYKLIIYL